VFWATKIKAFFCKGGCHCAGAFQGKIWLHLASRFLSKALSGSKNTQRYIFSIKYMDTTGEKEEDVQEKRGWKEYRQP
jgi:hypothetical protein